jgi:hypothetical protein
MKGVIIAIGAGELQNTDFDGGRHALKPRIRGAQYNDAATACTILFRE